MIEITIKFEEEAIWQAADDNNMTFNHTIEKIQRFANTRPVKKMIIEGTVMDPFPRIN
tara:strand:+ start:811 stop:984 length:174 start_codon:yes stop_codon:yes gene_type:complete